MGENTNVTPVLTTADGVSTPATPPTQEPKAPMKVRMKQRLYGFEAKHPRLCKAARRICTGVAIAGAFVLGRKTAKPETIYMAPMPAPKDEDEDEPKDETPDEVQEEI